MQKKNYSNFNLVGFATAGLLCLVVLTMIFPAIDNSAHATCADGDTSEGCATTRASMEAEVNVGTSIAIAMDSKVTMDIIPSSTGSVSAVSSKVQVATNSIDGYALFMKADPALVNTSTANDGAVVNSIANTTTTSTLSNMVENTYGYSISEAQLDDTALMNTVYAPLDTTGTTPIRQTTSTSIGTSNTDYGYGEEYYLNLGAKVGTNLPAGTYAGTVTLSAVANPVTVRSMAGLKYMQDMTTDICANTIEHYTKRLTDTRDGKEYWVAKLRDGNCWMVQNLALDLSTEKMLTSVDTDLDFVPKNADGSDYEFTPTVNTDSVVTAANYGTKYASYNADGMLFALPTYVKRCLQDDGSDLLVKDLTKMAEQCGQVGIVDISGEDWKPTYTAQVGNYILPNGDSYPSGVIHSPSDVGVVAVDVDAKTYDAHYLIGNYYQWRVALAGTLKQEWVAGGVAGEGSICPKGWQLPNSGRYPSTNAEMSHKPLDVEKSFYRLLLAYGYRNYNDYIATSSNSQIPNLYGEIDGVNQNVYRDPLYLSTSGVAFSDAGINRIGSYGYLISRTFSDIDGTMLTLWHGASSFPTSATSLSPANGDGMSSAMSVRCLAR